MQLHFSFMASLISAEQRLNASGGKEIPTHRSQIKQKCFLHPEIHSFGKKSIEVDRSELHEDLKEYGRFTGLYWLIRPEPPAVSKLPIPTIEEIIYSEEFYRPGGFNNN